MKLFAGKIFNVKHFEGKVYAQINNKKQHYYLVVPNHYIIALSGFHENGKYTFMFIFIHIAHSDQIFIHHDSTVGYDAER